MVLGAAFEVEAVCTGSAEESRMHRSRNRHARRRFTAIASGVAALTLMAGAVTPAIAAPGDGVLTVEVNRDFSGDGLYEAALDPGQSGIEVTVTDGATTLGPTTTDANGRADFDLGTLVGSRFRVDVSIPATAPDYLEFAPAATTAVADAYRSATTFVDGSTQTIHVGVWNPNTYVTRNPKVAIAQQVSRGTAGSKRSLMVTDWDNRGPFDMSTTDNTTGIAQVASQAETGTVFGTAWDYRRNGLFSAAYAKSYTVYGPGGPGGIYRTDTAAGGTTGNTVLWATVPNAGTSAHQTIAGRDDAFFLAAGSEGLGGLALSEDGATLYAVNLADKSLYTFDAAAAAPAASTGSTLVTDPGCVGGDWRPFAVTVRDGEVYVGGICDASTSLSRADLAVHILRLDGGAFSPVYSHGLDFLRGSQAYPDPVPNLTGPQVSLHWNPWRDSWDADIAQSFSNTSTSRTPIYPMPLLTSFAFENDGSIVLDFRDRKTDSYPSNGTGPDGVTPTAGHVAGGDLNKVCLTGGVYEWEGEGACPNNATPANSAQPAGRVEFFPGEFMTGQPRYGSNVTHSENSLGAVLLSPRENDLIATTMNPTQLYNSSGLGYYDRQAGTGPGNDWQSNALLIAGNSTAGNFGKGSGLGGVSLLAAPAPIQIGNYVWFDEDRDGEQGADEIAVPGATVRLLDADGNVLAETTTDENGEYYFGGEGGYPLVPGTEYLVEFDLTTVDPTQLPGSPSLDDLSFTVSQDPDAGEIHDSNPTPTDNPLIGRAAVTAPDHPGGVDHTIDAGIFFGRPGIDIVKFDGRAEVPEDPVDGPDAVDGTYGDPTPGVWDPAVDADTESTAVEYPLSDGSTGPQPVDMIVTNTGNLSLTDVSVADLTVEGEEIADLSCDFSPLGGPATGTSWDGPFEPGASFTCTGTLTMGPEELHHDIASVTAQPVDDEGEPFGEEIGDEDPYWAITPALPPVPGIDIVKFDGRVSAPENPVDGPDPVDGEYGDPTPGEWAPEVDADTEDEAVEYHLDGDSTGPQPVDMIITNTGELALADVTVADLTVQGSALTDVSCDFSPLGGPTTGTSWSGPFQPGDSFTCRGSLTMGPAELHHDIASVTGQPVDENGAPVGETIGDEDPYWAKTPEKPVPGTEEPGVGITKRQAKTGNEADTAQTAVTAKAGERVSVEMPVTNTGDESLTRVVVSDRTDNGPAMTEFRCTFPDGTKVDAVNGEVRWAATFADPATAQWQPGVTFICTGVVTLAATQTHADTVAVHAVAPDGTKVSDDNSFHVRTPDAPGLSVTGSTISLVLIAFAVMLVALGTVLILSRRRGSGASDMGL